jgi:methoxymalonate biosynthesis acyl carrier protein
MTIPSPREREAAAVEAELLAFLESKTRLSWEPGADIFASGVVTSLFAMELVVHVEQAFGVTVDGEELSLDNFRSVRAIAALVGRLRAPTGVGRPGE